MMNKFKIISTEQEWRDELVNYRNDWYHTWDYHRIAYENLEGEPLLFVLVDGDDRIALPLLLREIVGGEKQKDMTSVYGYPGFLFSSGKSYCLYDKFIDEIKKWAVSTSVVSVFTRINSLVIDSNANFKGGLISGETVVVDLTLDEDEQKSRYRKNYRNLLRRLEKDGFTSDWSNSAQSIEDFKHIYTETMNQLNASCNYYFDDAYYNSLLMSNDFEVRIYSVYFNETKVCSGMFVFCDDIVQYHLSGTLPEFKNVAPTRMLIDVVRKDATELGFKFLHLGGGLGGERDTLFNFKYGFSKQAIEFRTLKLITNNEKYMALCTQTQKEFINEPSSFFPLYRKT